MSGANGAGVGAPAAGHTQADFEKASSQSLLQRITSLEDRLAAGSGISTFVPHSQRFTAPRGLSLSS